jgi:hypothetical protein
VSRNTFLLTGPCLKREVEINMNKVGTFDYVPFHAYALLLHSEADIEPLKNYKYGVKTVVRTI